MAFSIIFAAAAASFGEAWVDSTASAIRSNRIGRAVDLVKEEGINASLPADYAAVVSKLKTTQATAASHRRAETLFAPRLQRCLGDSTVAAFAALIKDAAKPLEARMALLGVLATGGRRLGSSGQQTVSGPIWTSPVRDPLRPPCVPWPSAGSTNPPSAKARKSSCPSPPLPTAW